MSGHLIEDMACIMAIVIILGLYWVCWDVLDWWLWR